MTRLWFTVAIAWFLCHVVNQSGKLLQCYACLPQATFSGNRHSFTTMSSLIYPPPECIFPSVLVQPMLKKPFWSVLFDARTRLISSDVESEFHFGDRRTRRCVDVHRERWENINRRQSSSHHAHHSTETAPSSRSTIHTGGAFSRSDRSSL